MKLDVQSLSVTLGETAILKDASFLLIAVNLSALLALMDLVKRRC